MSVQMPLGRFVVGIMPLNRVPYEAQGLGFGESVGVVLEFHVGSKKVNCKRGHLSTVMF